MNYPQDTPGKSERVLVWLGEWAIATLEENELRPEIRKCEHEWKDIEGGGGYSPEDFPAWEHLPPAPPEESKP